MPPALEHSAVCTLGVALAIIAPKGRTPLAAAARLRLVRSGCATIPDPRRDAVDLACTEALRSGCAMVSLTSPSLLAVDTQRVEGHCTPIDGMAHVPCATARRASLAPVSPESLRPVLRTVFRPLQRGKALAELVCRDGEARLALAGTG